MQKGFEINSMPQVQRNSSIELLRLMCMLFIIAHHIISTTLAPNYSSQLYNYIEQPLHTAVVVFVLISGYFGIKFSPLKLVLLESQVLYYSIIIGLIAFCGIHSIGARDFLYCFFPISRRSYWFISAYVELYLFAPALNILLAHMSKRMHLFLILLLLYCCSILNYLPQVNQGSNLVYMSMIYLLGRYLFIYKDHMLTARWKSATLLIVYLICSIPFFILDSNTALFYYFWQFTFRYYGLGCIFMSVMIFYLFKETNFSSRIINRMAVSSLSVYLIHENHMISHYIYEYPAYALSRQIGEGGALIVTTLAVFFFCIMLDQIRLVLFEKLQHVFELITIIIESFFDNIYRFFS